MSQRQEVSPSVIMLAKELVEEFGTDEAVNNALKELRVKRLEANTPSPLPDPGERKTSVVILDKELVEEFTGDKAVNNALRELRVKRSDASAPPTLST
jgi:hypothetical protein